MFELGEEKNATIKIYNTAGRLIRLLKENEQMQIGGNTISWDGRDQNGSVCVTGLYVVSVKVEDKMATQTVVVMNK